ncbi:hypothetical protein AN220_28460, partial [Streptomyces nanshensis]
APDTLLRAAEPGQDPPPAQPQQQRPPLQPPPWLMPAPLPRPVTRPSWGRFLTGGPHPPGDFDPRWVTLLEQDPETGEYVPGGRVRARWYQPDRPAPFVYVVD